MEKSGVKRLPEGNAERMNMNILMTIPDKTAGSIKRRKPREIVSTCWGMALRSNRRYENT